MAKSVQIATVLYEVLKAMLPAQSIAEKTRRYSADVESKRGEYGPYNYNILPVYDGGVKPAIMELPEIKAALDALRKVDNLPVIEPRPDAFYDGSAQHKRVKKIDDILDWISYNFGFQKGNVANQREHLILLLANMNIRNKAESVKLDEETVEKLVAIIFKNYESWCQYVHCESSLRFPDDLDKQQLQLIYIALYLLIWGEASNIRFMPECLCYIFHHMCKDIYGILYSNVQPVSGDTYREPAADNDECFLKEVVTPIYEVLSNEAKRNNKGKAGHSNWRNYDDLNEYFWSDRCFELGWPMNRYAEFFRHSDGTQTANHGASQASFGAGKKKPKTNFAEVRTFLHLYRSFDRMWIFFILALQAMIITAWSSLGPVGVFFNADVFRNVMSIFITYAILNFLQVTIDIILSWKALRNMKLTQLLWYFLKFVVAAVWVVVLLVSYSTSMQNPSRHIKFVTSWAGDWANQSLYTHVVLIYLLPNIVAVILFFLPPLRRKLECSNMRIITLLMWWAQPKSYVGRGMHENMLSLLKYTFFWIMLLISKLAFSYYVEILPLVAPTKLIMGMSIDKYQWHGFFPGNDTHNKCIVIALWAPIILVYFMDTQMWYAIYATLFGGIVGAFSHLGEIRTLGMVHSIFEYVPSAFSGCFMPGTSRKTKLEDLDESYEQQQRQPPPPPPSLLPVGREDESYEHRRNIAYFSRFWNEFINSMREEDLISNRERDLLLFPYSSSDVSVVQWPAFLLASKIHIAFGMAKNYKKKDDADLFKKIKNDGYMYSAVVECYETLKKIIYDMLDREDWLIVEDIHDKVERSIQQRMFVSKFNMSGFSSLGEKLEEFSTLLVALFNQVSSFFDLDGFYQYISVSFIDPFRSYKMLFLLSRWQQYGSESDNEELAILKVQIVSVLQDIVEIITADAMGDTHFYGRFSTRILKKPQFDPAKWTGNIKTRFTIDKAKDMVTRLHLLLTVKESAINVPQNLDARRRITFFANSLFMNMPKAPKVRDMLSFSVLTPYYKEDVLYSEEELQKENEDGISILFYLKKIYPDEWTNFCDRIDEMKIEDREKKQELIGQWASYRGQTLYRTVRGMMYYRQALILQFFLEYAGDNDILGGWPVDFHGKDESKLLAYAHALADLKFTYVVSCQAYGSQKKSKNPRDRSCYTNILNLMLKNPGLRVAYIDETEELKDSGESQKVYYSVLVKGGDKYDEEIYRIKLPGSPTEIGEGKPENQNHAIIFTRGEALQTIDMNQDNYFEEAFKMRNVLEEFCKDHNGQRKPTILGLREHIFTGSVSSLAWFMSNQETSFVTISQRILANPLRVRFHYGHPDIFDRIFHITRGGISKASKVINLSEDIFAGFNSTLRQGFITYHEYIQVGKGRDVGMNQISLFEAKVANGNGEQTLSRDVYRLGQQFDFFRMLSFYFTTVGFYFSSMIIMLTVYAFLYGRVYMVLSGVEREILRSPIMQQNKAVEQAFATQSVVQLGSLLVLPMVMEIGLEKGFRTALADFIIMQLQLASVFFTFHLGTKAHYYGRTLLHGGSKYRPTGRGFVVFHAKFADNYRMYSRSHFVKGLEIITLLIVYEVYGELYRSSLYLFITFSMWFLAISWLFAPFLFNPSGFDWQKTVDDWTNWKNWLGNHGGIGISSEKSWESWWKEENEHLKRSNIRGKLFEIILACRFFIYQYGIVYHLDIAHHSKSLLVYGLSWAVLVIILIVLKMVSTSRQRFGTNFQLIFRILNALIWLGIIAVTTDLFVIYGLTISDLFAAVLAFVPSGWALILIAQICRAFLKGARLWDSVKVLARAYEYVMGSIIFMPVAVLSWFPFVSEFQTRLLFNQAFSRGLHISMILAGKKDTDKSE